MNAINRFNLIDEPWIPIVDVGRVSLKQLFSRFDYRALGGNPIQKIALTKLLLAIAQSACTPKNDEEWKELGVEGLSEKCLTYLERMYDRFWLYGKKPFLQMPKIAFAESKSFGAVSPEIATGNTTILKESQREKPLSDADKALLIVSLMGCGLGGKKTDNKVVLSEGYQKKPTGSPGPFVGSSGLMHSFLLTNSLLETILINLFTKKDIDEELSFYSKGLGIAPWEEMPEGEECPVACSLKNSLMGRLVPVSRFCLINEDKLHYSEGIKYPDYKDGGIDPSIAISSSHKKPKVLWVDSEKRPCRFLTALLSFMCITDFDCLQIKLCLKDRARGILKASIGIWSGGLKISSNAGEQYVSGMDDFVDSNILLPIECLGKSWVEQLKSEMDFLDQMSKELYKSTLNYLKTQKMKGDSRAKVACNLYWQLCECNFKNLLDACNNHQSAKSMRKVIFFSCVNKTYDLFCPKDTARQLEAWAKNRPNPKKYLEH